MKSSARAEGGDALADPESDDVEPFAVERAVLMTAGVAQSSSRMLDGLLTLLIRKGLITQAELDEVIKEPAFAEDTSRQYQAFYSSIRT
jgi:hypothetical protein